LAPLSIAYHTALCVVPPPELWKPIQAIRQQRDKAFQRWPPHINVLFPFVEAAHDGQTRFDAGVLTSIQVALADQSPFDISLDRFGCFHGTVVWLGPDPAASAAIQRVAHCLDATFASNANAKLIEKQKRAAGGLLTPHMTVGQWSKGQSSASVVALGNDWEPIRWRVDHVCIVSRTGPDSPMEVRHRIPLGSVGGN
jgi:poly(A) polymerase